MENQMRPVNPSLALPALLCAAVAALSTVAHSQDANVREIPVPRIAAPLGTLPGVGELPSRPQMPDVMVMNDGTRVTTPRQWAARRQEMRRILSYYAVGQMPPPPGNVEGTRRAIRTGARWSRQVPARASHVRTR